jgi:hypothetical protein
MNGTLALACHPSIGIIGTLQNCGNELGANFLLKKEKLFDLINMGQLGEEEERKIMREREKERERRML